MNLVIAMKRISIFTVVLLLAVQAMAITEAKKQAIAERIKPVGSVCLQGDDCGGVSVAANAGPKDPADVYSGKCAMCHDTGAGGAPKVGVVGDWAARISQGNETMYKHAVEGFNGMPAMGLCMDCTPEDIHAIVDLMVSKSQ